MTIIEEWVQFLEQLIELRGTGKDFDEMHKACARESAELGPEIQLLILEGEFELAIKELQKLGP